MRSHLLPLGLAALLFNPSFAQTADTTDAGGNDPAQLGAARAIEPAGLLTLKAAQALAFSANPELAAAGRELEALEAGIIQARLIPNPQLETLIEDTRAATRTTTLQLNQPIELGGKRAARIRAAERGRDVAAADLDARRAEIRAAVMAAFYDTLAAQERLRLAQASVELAQSVTTIAARRVAAGKVSPVEEIKARVAEAGVRIELTSAASELASARKRLTSLWGNPSPRFERAEGELEVLPPLPVLAELDSRLGTAPGLTRVRIEVARRDALAQIERSRRVPDVIVGLGAKRDEALGHDQVIFGMSIPIPLFDRNQGNRLQALRRADQARDALSAAELQSANALALAYARLDVARSEAESLQRDILPGARRAFEAASKGFELGKFSFLDVLDAQRTLFQAKSQYLRALAEAHRSAAAIGRVLGNASPDASPTPAAKP